MWAGLLLYDKLQLAGTTRHTWPAKVQPATVDNVWPATVDEVSPCMVRVPLSYDMIPPCSTGGSVVRYGTVQYDTTRYGAVRYGTLLGMKQHQVGHVTVSCSMNIVCEGTSPRDGTQQP